MNNKLIVFIIFVTAASVISGQNEKVSNNLEPTLDNLLNSLENLMIFFSKRYDKLNVDGLFGIRSVEGELKRALEKASAGDYPEVRDNIEVKNKIKSILKLTEQTAELALSEVKKKEIEYSSNFLLVITKPWTMYEVKPQLINKAVKTELPWTRYDDVMNHKPDVFDEHLSDNCMGTLLGNDGQEKCNIDVCWEHMTKLDTKLYYTTHQILWFQLGIRAGCLDKIQEKLVDSGGLEKMLQKLCTSIIFQMESLFQNGSVPDIFRDIFLEQGMVCGTTGFMDAVNRTWLAEVMKWQHPKLGCFREIELNPDFDYGMIDDLFYQNKIEWQKRNLLMDVEMGDYCSAHKSGVAAGFYAAYLRLFIDPDYMRHKLWPELYGEDFESKLIRKHRMLYFSLGLLIAFAIFYMMGPRRRYKLLSKLKFNNRSRKIANY